MLGEKFARRRTALKLSQTEVARRVSAIGGELSQQSLSQFETGEVDRILPLPELAKVLELDFVYRRSGLDVKVATPEDSERGAALAQLVMIPEFDVRAVSGQGRSLVQVDKENASDLTVNEWGFPRDTFRQTYGTPPESVKIIRVVGDSMASTLTPGEIVLVDINDRRPSPPGIFVFDDGVGLVLKRIEVIHGSDPPRVRIMSDNPRYETFERTLDEIRIDGRVICGLNRF